MTRLFDSYKRTKSFLIKTLPSVIFLFLLSVFYLRAVIYLDPDFGWRIKTGEFILNNGHVPKTDIFTYSMSSFPFVDHAWLQSVLFALVNDSFGKTVLTFIYTAMAMMTCILVLARIKDKVSKKSYQLAKDSLGIDLSLFGSFTFLLTIYILSLFFGIRAQVTSWLMLSLLLYFLLDPGRWQKVKYYSPIFFIFWANLHGSFSLGVVVAAVVLLARSFRVKKVDFGDILLLFLIFLATLANPYGIGVWRESISSILDQKLKWTIVEWMPALTMLNLPLAIFVALSLVFIIKQAHSLLLEEKVLFFCFLLAAISSRRHLPLWVIVAYPSVISTIYSFYLQVVKIKAGKRRFKKAYKIAWIGISLIIFIHIPLDFVDVYSLREDQFYPHKAVSYLRQNLPQGRIFSEYGWGGYLIWKLPEKKVYIDGRMPSWRWSAPNELESDSAFDDYNDFLKGKLDYNSIFEKYDIDTVLWNVSKPESPLDKFYKKIGKIVFKKEEDFKLLEALEKDGWNKLYEDETAVIYQKPS